MQLVSIILSALAAAQVGYAIAPVGRDDSGKSCRQVALNMAGGSEEDVKITSDEQHVLEATLGQTNGTTCKIIGRFPAGSIVSHATNTKLYLYDMNVKYRRRGDPLKGIYQIKPFTKSDVSSITTGDLIAATTFDLSAGEDFEVVLGENFKCKEVLRFKGNVTGTPYGEIEYRQTEKSGLFVQVGGCA